MGKVGRIACIFTPYAMTIISMVLVIIVELGGKDSGSSLLNNVYAWQADFTNMTVADTSSAVGQAVNNAKSSGQIKNLYQIHIYNYCSASAQSTGGHTIDFCSDRSTGFVFDPIQIWHLNSSAGSTKRQSPVASAGNGISNGINSTEAAAKAIFGEGVADSLKAYQTASKWMAIAFQVSLWTNVATAITGILAIFSRWGSFITWLLAIVNSIFTFGAALTATIIFGTLVGALKLALDKYKIEITLGGTFLAYIWIATALSIAATSFWLFSVCCCSGKSNPHHRSNKGGLWAAEPKHNAAYRGMRVEQTGGYQRVASPFAADRVPLHEYPAPMGGHQHQHPPHTDSYEPFRYQR